MKEINFASSLEKMILHQKSEFFYVNINNIRKIVHNLKFVYYSVVASENLLAVAISQLQNLESTDFNNLLLSYYVNHLEEEQGHCKWLAEDLSSHGVDLSGYDLDAMAMIGSQYYMIYHEHPACLLGYLAVVEGTPTPIEEIEKLERIYGKKLFRFSRFHSIKDMEHKIELFSVINKLPDALKNALTLSTEITLQNLSAASKHWI